jgi:hypothetical protein
MVARDHLASALAGTLAVVAAVATYYVWGAVAGDWIGVGFDSLSGRCGVVSEVTTVGE